MVVRLRPYGLLGTVILFLACLSPPTNAAPPQPAEKGAQDDSSNNKPPLNTTKKWKEPSVLSEFAVEEGIIRSERNREISVASFDGKFEISPPIEDKVTPEPEEVYEGINIQDESEEKDANAEKARKQALIDNFARLPFQEPSDTDFLKTIEYSSGDVEKQKNDSSLSLSHVEEGILDSERDRDETLSNFSKKKDIKKKDYGVDYNTDLSDRETENSNDQPKFEFLIGVPVENFTHPIGNLNESQTRKPFTPPKSAWPVPQAQLLTAGPKLNHTTGVPSTSDAEESVRDGGPVRDRASLPATPQPEDYVELIEVVKSGPLDGNRSNVVTFIPHVNGTGFFVENDAPDSSFTDLQTLFLACFATLLPLLVIFFIACGVRMAWRSYVRDRRGPGYQGGLRGGSADPLPNKNAHSPGQQLKVSEEGGNLESSGDRPSAGGPALPAPASQPAANGSIITMTLKNNHLIVETEVRNDIARGARETKMKYSANNNGVFVVEVQQGSDTAEERDRNHAARSSPAQRALVHRSPLPAHASMDTDEEADYMNSLIDSSPNNPMEPKVNGVKHFGSTNTGLSTSDLSISSAGSHNPSYAYGNQVGYDQGHYGYPLYSGYEAPPMAYLPCESSREPLVSKTPTDIDKPVVTAAIFKQDSIIIGEDSIKNSGYSIEGSTDGPLFSDIQAREISLHKLQDKIEHGSKIRVIANSDSVHSSDTDEEKHQEQQRQLGNGSVRKEQTVVEINHDKSNQYLHRADSLPPRLMDEEDVQKNGRIADSKINDDRFDVIEEESSLDCYPGDIASGSPLLGNSNLAASGARSKRASLPIITPDLYNSLKQTTKNILPNTSPKFEKFNNDSSPLDSISENHSMAPPLITVTEESEVSACSTEDVAVAS